MEFDVRMGVPEMRDLWRRLQAGAAAQTLNREERELAKKFAKAVKHLRANPYHPGLQSHDIDDLTTRFGRKVFESYIENNTPAAGRLFWVYGPGRQEITVIGLEPHPEDAKNGAYRRVNLSQLPLLSVATTDAVVSAFSENSVAPDDAAMQVLAGRVSAEFRQLGLDAGQMSEAIPKLIPNALLTDRQTQIRQFVTQCKAAHAKAGR